MAAVAVDGEARGMDPKARIGTITQLRGAGARVRAAGWRVLVVWLGLAVGGQVVRQGFDLAGVDAAAAQATPGYLAYALAASAISGLGAAWAMRLMSEPARWLRFDRSLLEGAGITAGMVLCLMVLGALNVLAVQSIAEPGLMAVVGLSVALLALVLVWVGIRLTLWPMARVAGRTDITPAISWRLMRRATRGMLLGYAVLLIPLIVLLVPLMVEAATAGVAPSRESLLASEAASSLFTVLAYGLVATVYTLRVEKPAKVADVFD
ncbi:hypothetical protein [Phenylobacterium sp. CCH12-B4]|uniref:hypothetical protein n=1 Tax=Phenylobacterium sp. CCH12-B4 TaxID=1768784 RepID=UPI0012E913E6|nr:hypothetical protein [Phenylobacterium sp. CCH12-B4]